MKTEIAELVETLQGLAREKYSAISQELIETLLNIQADHFDDPSKVSRLMFEAVEKSIKLGGKRDV